MCIFHDYTRWGIPTDSYNVNIKQARVCKNCGKIQVRNLGYLNGLYAEGIKKSLGEDISYCGGDRWIN